jgi:acyl carrier protein
MKTSLPVFDPTAVVVMALREVAPSYTGPLSFDTALGVEGVGLDSIGFFEFILTVERLSGTELRKESLDAAALATVGSFADLVERMRTA